MQSASPGGAPALHLLTSYFIDSLLGGGGGAAGHAGGGRRGGAPASQGAPGSAGGRGRAAAAGEDGQPRGGREGGRARATRRAGRPSQRPRGARAAEAQAAPLPHHLQQRPAAGAGARLPQVPLPRRLHQRRTCDTVRPHRSPSPGVVSKPKGEVEETGKTEIPGNRSGISWTPPLGLYLDVPLNQTPLLDPTWRSLPISAVAVPPMAPTFSPATLTPFSIGSFAWTSLFRNSMLSPQLGRFLSALNPLMTTTSVLMKTPGGPANAVVATFTDPILAERKNSSPADLRLKGKECSAQISPLNLTPNLRSTEKDLY